MKSLFFIVYSFPYKSQLVFLLDANLSSSGPSNTGKVSARTRTYFQGNVVNFPLGKRFNAKGKINNAEDIISSTQIHEIDCAHAKLAKI